MEGYTLYLTTPSVSEGREFDVSYLLQLLQVLIRDNHTQEYGLY